MLKQDAPTIVADTLFEAGVNITIADEAWRVYNTDPASQMIRFAKVLKSGKLAKLGPKTVCSYDFDTIARFVELASIVVDGSKGLVS